MKTAKLNDVADRRAAATNAKTALLEAYRAKMEAAEPLRAARQQEQLALAAAREERRQERDRLKAEARAQQEEQARIAAQEAEAVEAAAAAEAAATKSRQSTDSLVARVVNDEAARKAERDRRYANRKARQR